LARTILSSSRSQLERGPFDIALQLSSEELLDILEWITLADLVTSCHFSKFLVAEVEGEPVGALAAFDPADSEVLPVGAALSDAFSGMGYDEAALQSALRRLEAIRKCLPSATPGTWVVEWVAVEEHYRRRGVALRMLQEIIDRGTARSLPKAQISTYVGNMPAIGAYQRAGFKIDRELRDSDFANLLGVPGMVSMLRPLP
jgi:ribosomal protein S18 acetylase RimI-like enzyme